MLGFGAPDRALGDMDAEAASRLFTAAADVTLVMDGGGVIRDVAFGAEDLATATGGRRAWLDRALIDAATEESRGKVTEMLAESAARGASRWRHVNLRVGETGNLPLLLTAARGAPKTERTLVFGRDLRQLASLQQRLVEAQQAMEREYARLRQAETRYRLLFQMSAEPVLVLDAQTLRIVEANLAADRLFGAEPSFLAAFSDADRARVSALFESVRGAGQSEERRVTLAGSGRPALLSASLLRQERGSLFLVRLSFPAADIPASTSAQARLADFVESTPDAFVLADSDGRILTANPAFLDLAQLPNEGAARGEPMARWLGRQAVEMDVLLAQVRGKGPVRLFRTVVRGEHGTEAEVEVSATPVTDGNRNCFGFTIRDVGPRPAPPDAPNLPAAAGQLTELVGRVPLKELVREATDVIEKLAIEAALELTKDNRASAAEMLGLSRQSLYVKLRRYGIGDLGPEEEN